MRMIIFGVRENPCDYQMLCCVQSNMCTIWVKNYRLQASRVCVCVCVYIRIWEWLKSATWSGSCRESGIWVETAQPAKPRRSAANQMPCSDVTQLHRPIKRSVTTVSSHTPPTTSWWPTATRLDQSQCLLFSTSVTSSLWGKLFDYLEGGDLSRAIRGSNQCHRL